MTNTIPSVIDLLRKARDDMDATEERLEATRIELRRLENESRAARIRLRALMETIEMFGGIEGVTSGENSAEANDWASLNKADAIERLLREAGHPLHIKQIINGLVDHGREEESYNLISASLANLKRRRQIVDTDGRGNWFIVPPGEAADDLDEHLPGMADDSGRDPDEPPQWVLEQRALRDSGQPASWVVAANVEVR